MFSKPLPLPQSGVTVFSLFAYLAAAIVGAMLLEILQDARTGVFTYFISGFAFYLVVISVSLFPFWFGLVLLVRKYLTEGPLLYGILAIPTANVIGSTFIAIMPQMMWDTGPQLNYGERWARAFHFNLLSYSIIGVIAGLIYGFLATRLKK